MTSMERLRVDIGRAVYQRPPGVATGGAGGRGLAAALAALALVFVVPTDSPGARKADAPLSPAGRVLFQDDFDSGAPSPAWAFDDEGEWRVTDGKLRITMPNGKQRRSFAYAGSDLWRDYCLDLDLCGLSGVDKGVAVRVEEDRQGVGIDLRGPGYDDLVVYRGWQNWARGGVKNPNGAWHHVRIYLHGNRYRVYLDQKLVVDYTDVDDSRPRGRIALAAYTGGVGECEILYDNVVVRALK